MDKQTAAIAAEKPDQAVGVSGEHFDYLDSIYTLVSAIKIIASDRGERDFETIRGLAANLEDSISNFQESLLSSMPDNKKQGIFLKH